MRPAAAAVASGPAAPSFRRDIQGLRAVAVGLVVVYHLFPDLLHGGFVGVDVFFVISGYLITGHMVREMRTRGAIDLLGFYARRARRLVPAATVVLLLTWLASIFVLPGSRLTATAQQVAASAVYVQNWLLARDSVDYLTAEDAASPVQHYWSLSVEEQFYVGWPLLLVLAGVLARAVHWEWRRVTLLLGGVVCALSLGASVVLTASNGAAAYFVTQTRVWELAMGALLAVLAGRPALPQHLARGVRWFGLALVIGSAVAYSSATPFPGTAALVPVVGTILVLAAGSVEPHTRLLGSAPLTWVGDRSYALYLVHWPLIVLYGSWSGGEIGILDGPVLLGASIVSAALLTRFVENPVRDSRAFASRSRGVALALAAAIPVALVLPQLLPGHAGSGSGGIHPGAAVLAGDAEVEAGESSIDAAAPSPAEAAAERPVYYDRGCELDTQTPGTAVCEFGELQDPRLTVALVGDSKIGQWLPAIQAMADQQGWRVVTYMRSRCAWTATQTTVGAGDDSPYTLCSAWGSDVLDRLRAEPPDVILTSDRPSVGIPEHPEPDAESHAAIAQGMLPYWHQMEGLGSQVVAIRETPEMGINVPDCVSAPGASLEDCDRALDRAVQDHGPMVLATRAMGGEVPLVDMTDLLCADRTCSPVIGHVLVYRDKHHLTKAYVMSLAPYLEDRLAAAGVGEPRN
jgi:peptidoglycan/LPS O-acetylase OafA/YrhL